MDFMEFLNHLLGTNIDFPSNPFVFQVKGDSDGIKQMMHFSDN